MKAGDNPIRTVITGVGVVSPIGIGNDAFWKSLIEGRSGIGYLRAFPSGELPTKLAAQIHDFEPDHLVGSKKLLKVMSRDIQLGVVAASLSMNDARLTRGDVDPDRLGVSFGAGRISTTPEELADAAAACTNVDNGFEFDRWGQEAMGEICPLWLLRQLPNMPACHVSIEFDARGPNNTITCRESSALLALAEAVGVIRRGAADCMIVGASSSNIHPVDIAKLSLFDGLSRAEDPQGACRPFDFDRDGTIVGEGGAAFVVERYNHAVRRGAKIYAEIVGIAAGCDGTGFSNGAGGTGLVRAVQSAMRQAGMVPSELGHINAHGKSTQRDDLVEARALHRAFDDDVETIPVTALKSYFGHFDAGSGAVELAGSLLALERGTLPMTLNYETPDPRCRLRVVQREPMRLRQKSALTVNRTAMGQSAAAILRAV
jgi:3-oxoacyl-[acyl-carrier-protein] synthase II